ncbi:class I adenylate-forming enzyme family protein [Streptomyces sp. NPDC005708]|uniref:class I adenylate-forming enzyme family protein n=1 Tax=Streptomyces sp. NPDC005708 TaxID=3154564 RepID=UPI0033F66B93
MLSHVDVLRRNASAYGPRVAITSATGTDITYAELDRLTNSLANALVDAGFGTGDRLVWLDWNSADFLIAYYATAKAGMTFSALNAWLRPNELTPQLELLEPAVIVAGESFVDTIEKAYQRDPMPRRFVREAPARGAWDLWQQFASSGRSDRPPAVENDEQRIHEIVFTSGTTGQAKGVMRTQRARILDSAFAALGYELTREDHLLGILPQFHVGGAAVPNQLLIQGGRVTILRQYDPQEVAKALASGVTYIVGVPAHYSLLFESGYLDGVDTSGVRGVYVGGSAATPTLFEAIRAHFPSAELVHGYGSTESAPHTLALRGEAFLNHFGSLGLPVAGTEVRVVAADGVDAASGEVGELWVRSDSVMSGYLGRPDLTAEAFAEDGWLRTGDLVRRADDGYFTLVDRAKDLIISGGENIYPREVEDVIATYPGVGEVAVVGLPDPLYEEKVVAFVRVAEGSAQPDAGALRAYVRERLAGYKVPRVVHFVEDLPRTGAGKVVKAKLRETWSEASS